MDSISDSWSNGPSIVPPPEHPGQRPPSRGHIYQIEERQPDGAEFAILRQDQRPQSVATYPFYREDQSADPVRLEYGGPHLTGDISENANAFPPDDRWRQSISYETQNGPPVINDQSYRPHPAYAPPIYAFSGGLQDRIRLNIAFASSSGPNYNRRKASRTPQACDACRFAKAKCDDPKPCSSCRHKGIECVFKIPEPKDGDKVKAETRKILGKIVKQQGDILKKLQAISQVSRRDEKLVQALIKHMPELGPDSVSDEEEANPNILSTVSQHVSPLDNVYQQAGFNYSQHSPDRHFICRQGGRN